jgi:hypothetical protein
VGLGARAHQFNLSRKNEMITKKELALVADAVFRCGLASGFSGDEIIAFAKHTAPTKDLDWIAALTKTAKGNKHDR